MTFALNLGAVRRRGLPHENPTTPAQIEANRRAWLDQNPGLLGSLVVIVSTVAVAFAIAGAVGSIDTITTSATRHGLSGWAAWTPWAGAEGVLLLLVAWRVFCGLRRRSSGFVVRLASWGAAAGALTLNAAPSYEAGDWVGVAYHLAIPLATIVSVEILERLVAAVVALILGTDQLAEADAAAARTIRADRWVRRSHRWAGVPAGRVLSVVPRAVARGHVERVIKHEPDLLAGAKARIATFAALDCGTANIPDAPAGQRPAEEEAEELAGPAETVTVERADQAPPAATLEQHAADALALVAPEYAALPAAPEQPAKSLPGYTADGFNVPYEEPVGQNADGDQAGQDGQDDQLDPADAEGDEPNPDGQDDQLDQDGDEPDPAQQDAQDDVEGEQPEAEESDAAPIETEQGSAPASAAFVPAQAARQVVTAQVPQTSTTETGNPDGEADEPEVVEQESPEASEIQAGTGSQAAFDALTAGREAANRERAEAAKADRRALALSWYIAERTGRAGTKVKFALDHGTSEKRLRAAIAEHPIRSFTAEELQLNPDGDAAPPAQAGRP
ncbi:hypothetical protein ACFWA9_10275 [Kitasatospora sp. NPDC059973]|uniref:hypothetical protein n=1 Tax=Kitasatospora sp. NPDC059973 TaxID=3347020 RepID=UPI0036916C9B